MLTASVCFGSRPNRRLIRRNKLKLFDYLVVRSLSQACRQNGANIIAYASEKEDDFYDKCPPQSGVTRAQLISNAKKGARSSHLEFYPGRRPVLQTSRASSRSSVHLASRKPKQWSTAARRRFLKINPVKQYPHFD
jgi:hypothetical protein